MWDLFITVASFVVTIGLLVTVHEFGHFWVARRCGVKVLTFSIGFGKALWRRKDKQGTEYVIASIPLGGYVKMLDAREVEHVPVDLQHQEFTQKSVLQRIAIVSAGPIANFLFAIFAYWLMFMAGITQIRPDIGQITPDSIASKAGLVSDTGKIHSIDATPVESWSDVGLQLLKRIGETGEISLSVESGGAIENYQLAISDWLSDAEQPNPLSDLGISPKRPSTPAILAGVIEGGAGQKAGLQPGDEIIEAAGEPIQHWMDLVDKIQRSPNIPLPIRIERQNQQLDLILVPQSHSESGKTIGLAGIQVKQQPLPDGWLVVKRLGPIDALFAGVERTWDVSIAVLDGIKKLILGSLSVKNLSGPITIAKVAGDQAQQGPEAFIGFLAYISIMLGIMNLLPVPVLDGGHLMFYLVEAVRGKPLSDRVQQLSLSLGIAVLLGVMTIAIVNDISRL